MTTVSFKHSKREVSVKYQKKHRVVDLYQRIRLPPTGVILGNRVQEGREKNTTTNGIIKLRERERELFRGYKKAHDEIGARPSLSLTALDIPSGWLRGPPLLRVVSPCVRVCGYSMYKVSRGRTHQWRKRKRKRRRRGWRSERDTVARCQKADGVWNLWTNKGIHGCLREKG